MVFMWSSVTVFLVQAGDGGAAGSNAPRVDPALLTGPLQPLPSHASAPSQSQRPQVSSNPTFRLTLQFIDISRMTVNGNVK
jgi:hypothetical protein